MIQGSLRSRIRKRVPGVLLLYRLWQQRDLRDTVSAFRFLAAPTRTASLRERLRLLQRIYEASAGILCAHTQDEMLQVARAILDVPPELPGAVWRPDVSRAAARRSSALRQSYPNGGSSCSIRSKVCRRTPNSIDPRSSASAGFFAREIPRSARRGSAEHLEVRRRRRLHVFEGLVRADDAAVRSADRCSLHRRRPSVVDLRTLQKRQMVSGAAADIQDPVTDVALDPLISPPVIIGGGFESRRHRRPTDREFSVIFVGLIDLIQGRCAFPDLIRS